MYLSLLNNYFWVRKEWKPYLKLIIAKESEQCGPANRMKGLISPMNCIHWSNFLHNKFFDKLNHFFIEWKRIS